MENNLHKREDENVCKFRVKLVQFQGGWGREANEGEGGVGICSALIAGGRVSRERTEIGGHLGHLACHVIPLKCVLKYPNLPSKITPKLPYKHRANWEVL